MKRFKNYLIVLSSFLAFTACKIVDLRTPELKNASVVNEKRLEEKGKEILKRAWKKQGLDQLNQFKSYSFSATESRQGTLGKLSNPWKEISVDLKFQYAINTFDGRITILSGEEKGKFFGLQSWHYYEGNSTQNSAQFEIKENKRRAFAVPTFQYFVELTHRLYQAPVIRYVGEEEIEHVTYHKVLVTWGESAVPTKTHDQYLVYISEKTGFLELASYTAHDAYFPGHHYVHGNIKFSDFKLTQGIMIPMVHESIKGDFGKKTSSFRKLEIDQFTFNTGISAIIYPDDRLKKIGNEKP